MLLEQGAREYDAGHYAEALALFREAQSVSAAARLSPSADIYYRTGRAQLRLNRYADASESFERGLQLASGDGNRRAEAILLQALGEVLRAQGQPVLARQQYERALDIRRDLGERLEEARTLAEIASTYVEGEEFEEALTYYERARAGLEAAPGGSARDIGRLLIDTSSVYAWLGQYDSALALQAQAVAVCQKPLDHPCLASAFLNEGFVRFQMSDYHGSAAALRRALEHEGSQDRLLRAKTLNNLGLSLIEARQLDEGLDSLRQALAVFQELQSPKYVAATLDSIGTAYRALGDRPAARANYLQSLAIWRQIGYREGERATLANLGLLYRDQSQPMVAILFLKLAVNISQEQRASVAGLDLELQESLRKKLEPSYRVLASLLVDQGRLAEAQEVLRLLKEEEYQQFLRGAPDHPQDPATLTGPEPSWQARYLEISEKIALLGREFAELQQKEKDGLTESERNRREQLVADLEVAKKGYDQFIQRMEADVERQAEADRVRAEIERRRLDSLDELQGTLDILGHNVVALHFLVTSDRVRIILTTPSTQVGRESLIASTELNHLIEAFREQIERPQTDPQARGTIVAIPGQLPEGNVRELAERLYRVLIAPVQGDLDQAGATTLMLSLDDRLRYVPFPALHDGHRYLVERYAMAILTDAARDKLRATSDASPWKVAGLGLTRAVTVRGPGSPNRPESFAALPSVKDEVAAVVHTIAGAAAQPEQIRLDEQFTEASLEETLNRAYSVVHIASHFEFRPGSEAASFLVLGDAKPLSLAQIDSVRFNFHRLELLTLSACETALGGGRNEQGKEIEGLGALAQRKGAQSVLATLWKVADSSTAVLMEQFYEQRKRGLTKAEALQHAQLTLLHGDTGTSRPGDTASPTDAGRVSPYAHPFYWAPYILMGNWL